MLVRVLDNKEIREIFENYMVNDFPKAELKPVEIMEEYCKRQWYKCFGVYEGDELIAYAFFFNGNESNCCILDYYSVVSKFRNKGHGGKALRLIVEEMSGYDNIFLEIEDIEYAKDENEKYVREHRKSFYLRNGVMDTPFRSKVDGVNYNIMYIPVDGEKNGVIVDDNYGDFVIRDIYEKMFGNNFFKKIYEILPNKKYLCYNTSSYELKEAQK